MVQNNKKVIQMIISKKLIRNLWFKVLVHWYSKLYKYPKLCLKEIFSFQSNPKKKVIKLHEIILYNFWKLLNVHFRLTFKIIIIHHHKEDHWYQSILKLVVNIKSSWDRLLMEKHMDLLTNPLYPKDTYYIQFVSKYELKVSH